MAFPDQVMIKLETNMAEELEPQWREQEECSVIPYQQSENTVSSTITSRSRNTWRWKPSNIVMKSEADCWTDNGQGIEAEPTDHCDTGNTSHLLQSQGRRKEKVNIKCEPYWDTDIDEPSGDKQKQDKEAESWSVKEEPQDPPSAVCSMTLSMSDNTSRSLLSLTRNHECQCCFATFVLVSSLELHMASIHGEELHVVLPASPTPDNCEADNYSSGCMETVSWPECRKTAEGMMDNNEIDKRTEIKNLHNNHKAFVCDVCSKAFTRACHLDKHKLVHSNSGHRPCVCDECNKAFTRVSDLNKHKLVHTSQKTFACDMCSKAFSQAGNLKRHKLIHTGHKPYACNVCHKAFFDSSYLKRHKLIHTDHKPFSCDVCNKGFNNTTSLKVHKRIHTGERPYKCPHCDSHFYSSSDRHTHIKTVHDGIRPHVCDVCAAAFSSTSNLKKHRKTHTGEKPHKCTDCGKGFIQLCNLKKHRLVHTGEKPYTCPLCPNAFIWPESLKKHMRKTHQ